MKQNHWFIVLGCFLLAGSVGVAWAAGAAGVRPVESSPILLDFRPVDSVPIRGMLRISPKAVGNGIAATLQVDGKTATGWSRTRPLFDSTKLADGWHEFTLKEGNVTSTARLWILNDERYVFHEGIVEEDETWEAGKVHLIHGWMSITESSQVVLEDDAAKIVYAPETGFFGNRKPSISGEVRVIANAGMPPGSGLVDDWEASITEVTVTSEVIYPKEMGLGGVWKNLTSEMSLDNADIWLDGRTTMLEKTVATVEETLGLGTTLASAEVVGSDWLGNGGTRAYVFLVRLGNGLNFTTVPEWWLEEDDAAEYAMVDPAGNLTAGFCEEEHEVVLCGSFVYGGETLVARKTVVILPSDVVPTTFELKKGWNLLACPFGRLTERSRAELLTHFQPYHYDAGTQTYVMSDGLEYNDSIWLHVDSDETIVLDLLVTQ